MSRSLPIRAAAAIAVAMLLAPVAGRAAAPDTTVTLPVHLGAGSSLWIEGTSTMHDFTCRSKDVVLTLAVDSATPAPANGGELMQLMRSGGVRAVTVRVPVVTLHSEKEGLDKNLQKAMKADRYPDVTFHLEKHEITPGAAADTVAIHASGALEICAAKRPIDLSARGYAGEGGVWLEGSESLLMSDYGIKPPTMMMGTIRVGDKVTVRYRLLLVP
jgi:YceI-like domain